MPHKEECCKKTRRRTDRNREKEIVRGLEVVEWYVRKVRVLIIRKITGMRRT